eukprot:6186257-Pleurochrysis_carterae.AAC.1
MMWISAALILTFLETLSMDYADGFKELYTLIVLCPTRHDRAVLDKSMACGHTEESMITFDSA